MAAQALDPRLIILTIETEQGLQTFDQSFNIRAIGSRFYGDTMNECQVQIFNLTRETQNFLLQTTSPFNLNRQPKQMFLDVGRVSTGANTRVFSGTIMATNPTQPPDIGITLRGLTGLYQLTQNVSTTAPNMLTLKSLCEKVTADLNAAGIATTLNFQAQNNPQVGNYTFTGGAYNEVSQLNQIGGIIASLDNGVLTVADIGTSLVGAARVLSQNTGMIGVPSMTEFGPTVTMLIDNTVQLGGALTIESQINPAANGTWQIFHLAFEIASRDTPFYFIADCRTTVQRPQQ